MRITSLLLLTALVGTLQVRAADPDSLKNEACRTALASISGYRTFLQSASVADLMDGVRTATRALALFEWTSDLDPTLLPAGSATDSVRACLTALSTDPGRFSSVASSETAGGEHPMVAYLDTHERLIRQAMATAASRESDEEIPSDTAYIPFERPPEPLPDHSPQPTYPEKARTEGVEGKVVVKVYVDKRGDVRKWEIAKAEPRGMGFEEEVAKVIVQWKFGPAVQKGKQVGAWVAIPFNFKYQKGEQPPRR